MAYNMKISSLNTKKQKTASAFASISTIPLTDDEIIRVSKNAIMDSIIVSDPSNPDDLKHSDVSL